MLDFFSKKGNEDSEEIVLIEDKMPKHIAIIMDGNGRWAKKRGLPRTMGHRAGVKTIKTIVKECDKLEVKYLTLYAFSTEPFFIVVSTTLTLLSAYEITVYCCFTSFDITCLKITDVDNFQTLCQNFMCGTFG